jgi:BolA protein
MNNEQRLAEIQSRLENALQAETIQVEDESHQHVGHAGARDGRGHFHVLVISAQFQGKTPIQRHRLVYQAMGELMQTDIHALAIDAYTPDEL